MLNEKREIDLNTVRGFFEKLNYDLKRSGNGDAVVPLSDVDFYAQEIQTVFGVTPGHAAQLAEMIGT